VDKDDVPPPPNLTSPQGEGYQGGVQQRCTIGCPSRSGDGSAHNNILSSPIPCLEHGGAQSGPRDKGGPHCIIDGAFKGAGEGGDSTVKEGVGRNRGRTAGCINLDGRLHCIENHILSSPSSQFAVESRIFIAEIDKEEHIVLEGCTHCYVQHQLWAV
jgi:hypothetical protein